MTPENAEDEIEPPYIDKKVDEIKPTSVNIDSDKEKQEYVIRSNRISRLHDTEKGHPSVYCSENNTESTKKDNLYTSSYYTKGKMQRVDVYVYII